MKLSRRQFLKATGLVGMAGLTGGCGDATRKLIPFVADPEDIVPGIATWYATTCRECPAGCGILAKNRDGRVIKVEGNPLHPVNTGRLCVRGQASLQGVYNPDRYQGPQIRNEQGIYKPISWNDAEKVVLMRISGLTGKDVSNRVVFLSDITTGAEHDLIGRFLRASNSMGHIMSEPLAYEALKGANRNVFGDPSIPSYSIDKADFLISFGADFLETWVSNVRLSRQFSRFREPGGRGRNPFVYVGPRLCLTGASADEWVSVPPGGQSTVALGLLRLIMEKNHIPAMDREDASRLKAAVAPFTPETVTAHTGVSKDTLTRLATAFMNAKRPLALAGGMGFQDPHALDTAMAANYLSSVNPERDAIIDFSHPSALTSVATAKEMKELGEGLRRGEVDVLFVLRTNPVFHLPPSWGFKEALQKVPLVVSLSSFPDETSRMAHLIMPTHTFLESWGDFTPQGSVHGLMQPVVSPIFDTRHSGDVLLSMGRAIKGSEAFPEKDFYEALRRSWIGSDEHSWERALRKGGSWSDGDSSASPRVRPKRSVLVPNDFTPTPSGIDEGKGLSFISYPTVQFFDGRMANRPFIQELPDPLSNITWDGWVEMHPDTARGLAVATGDMLRIESQSASIRAAAYVSRGIKPGVLAMPIGQGHAHFGRYAAAGSGNPFALGRKDLDDAGGMVNALSTVTVKKEGLSLVFAHTDGSSEQHGRDIVRSVPFYEYAHNSGKASEVVLPLPAGFKADRDIYAPHHHDGYRWAMAIDLDRCIGCGACVVACYAENNVAVVGRDQVKKGREMAWLHIQRYFEADEPLVRFLPILCQHCDEAPCESVCPVFAPHHNKEGINNQIYNRCIGTRYCSQNCPYKVRRFNWFTWKHDPPLEWQLNPDLTVRTKGVMEKCSFCIQRIVEAKVKARSEGRALKDGEFTTACAQTCPVDAITFGNLMDPQSRVAKLASDARGYQVLGELNTKPAVIYLKKIINPIVE
jgi:anaerobic selenocysteine-containing dehydrogenase/Fe-S-cluster-containing dehydrogenase component